MLSGGHKGTGPISWKLALTLVLIVILIGAFLSSCAQKRPPKGAKIPAVTATGIASWYGPRFHGRKTANGERYNQNALTAAHKTLPFDTKVRVTNLENGKDVVVRINDRGPYARGRIIDLSKKAAKQIAMLGSGTTPVRIEIVDATKDEPTTTIEKEPERPTKVGFKRIPRHRS